MQTNIDALLSLQNFLDERHASALLKEGLSIFVDPQISDPHCVLSCVIDPNHTHSLSGRALMRQWLHRPSYSMDVISTRHITLVCCLSSNNLTTVELMPRHFASFNHVPRALARLRSGKASIRDWHALVQVGSRLVY